MAPRKCSEPFEKSYKLAKYLQKASQDDMLDLYAFAIIAKQEKDLDTTPKPGAFDFTGKAKRTRWELYVNKQPHTPEQAEKAYIDKINALVAENGLKDGCPADLK